MKSIYWLTKYADIKEYTGFVWPASKSLVGNSELEDDFAPSYQPSTRSFTPQMIGDRWKARHISRDLGPVAPWNDYPCVSLTPAFSPKAIDCLGDLLEVSGEILPISTADGSYFVYNCLNSVDAIDHEKTDFLYEVECYMPRDVRGVERYVFPEKFINECPSFFRINQFSLYYFVSSDFVDRIRECDLNGFMPIKIYPLDTDQRWKENYNTACELSERKAKNMRRKRNGPPTLPPLTPLEFLNI